MVGDTPGSLGPSVLWVLADAHEGDTGALKSQPLTVEGKIQAGQSQALWPYLDLNTTAPENSPH